MEKVLIIDDDIEIHKLLSEYLTMEHFQVECAEDGETGLEMACSGLYDLILLDVMLPTINGFDVLRGLRAKVHTPVIMMSSNCGQVDRIVGLEIGADCYLPKPFDLRELLAHIRALLRRCNSPKENHGADPSVSEKIKVGDVEMDFNTRLVTCSGKQSDLTSAEFRLLETLLKNAGRLVSREGLIKEVLGRTPYPYDRSIDVHVARLRKKLSSSSKPSRKNNRIKTIRGMGYLYSIPAGEPQSVSAR